MTERPAARPSLRHLLGVWLSIGLQSFGGGASTFALIERAIVREQGWLTETEYVHDVALAQLSPGINLLGLTILIGRRLGGTAGVPVSLLGLLLPSVTITVLMTIGYAHIQHHPLVRAALRGVIPATVGLGLLTAVGLVRALFTTRQPGIAALILSGALLAGSALVLVLWHPPVILVLLGAGSLGAVAAYARGQP